MAEWEDTGDDPEAGSGLVGWAVGRLLVWGTVAVLGAALVTGLNNRFLSHDVGGVVSSPPVARLATSEGGRSAVGSRTVTLKAGRHGHFLVEADVEGTPVRFLVDTGASGVILSPADAERVGLNLRDRHFTERFNTANGVVRAAPVTLSDVQIGALTVRQVEAWVNGAGMNISLLGMTFLSRLDGYEVRGDTLILRY